MPSSFCVAVIYCRQFSKVTNVSRYSIVFKARDAAAFDLGFTGSTVFVELP